MTQCPGALQTPAALFKIRPQFAKLPLPVPLGECRHCTHAYTLNTNQRIREHGFHGCAGGVFVPDCPHGASVHMKGYDVLAELRLEGNPEY